MDTQKTPATTVSTFTQPRKSKMWLTEDYSKHVSNLLDSAAQLISVARCIGNNSLRVGQPALADNCMDSAILAMDYSLYELWALRDLFGTFHELLIALCDAALWPDELEIESPIEE